MKQAIAFVLVTGLVLTLSTGIGIAEPQIPLPRAKENQPPDPREIGQLPPDSVQAPNGVWIVRYVCQAETPQNLAARVNELSEFWKPLDPQAKIFLNTPQRSLTLTGKVEAILALQKLLALYDRPPRQVKVEVRVVEVSHSDSPTLDLDTLVQGAQHVIKHPQKLGPLPRLLLLTPPAPKLRHLAAGLILHETAALLKKDPDGPPVDGKRWPTVKAALEALNRKGQVEILSEPSIIVSAGQTATLKSVNNVPQIETSVTGVNSAVSVVTVFQEIGVTMANVISKDSAYLTLNPKVETITGTNTIVREGLDIQNPTFSTRQIRTQLTLRNGETVALGGLKSRQTTGMQRSFPIFDELFSAATRTEEETDWIFLVTVRIIEDGRNAVQDKPKP